MLPRTLEPEIMDDEQEASEYDRMSHAEVNRKFVADLLEAWPEFPVAARVLDLGTGTALIPLKLLEERADLKITAVDQSPAMLELAQQHIDSLQRSDQLTLQAADCCALPFEDDTFQLVMSNTVLHHLPEPLGFLQEAARVLQPGGVLFVRDLFRPVTEEIVEELVEAHAGQDPPVHQQLLRQSLHAAFRAEEIEALLPQIRRLQASIHITSDRHWTLIGRKRD